MAKAGRPRKQIDKEQFETMCEIQCTLEEIAALFKCSEDTIQNWCKREYGENFSVVHKWYSATGKMSLRRWQFKMAEKNAPMAIFLGKNYLGQTDKVEQTNRDVEDLACLAEMLNAGDVEDGDNPDN